MQNGLVRQDGASLPLIGAQLYNVTYTGTLDIATFSSGPAAGQGNILYVEGLYSSGGVIDLSKTGNTALDDIDFRLSQTLNNQTIIMGFGDYGDGPLQDAGAGYATIMLGPNTTVVQDGSISGGGFEGDFVNESLVDVASGAFYITSNFNFVGFAYDDPFINAASGTFEIGGAGQVYVSPSNFSPLFENQGLITIASGGSLNLAPENFVNTGTILVDRAAVLEVQPGGALTGYIGGTGTLLLDHPNAHTLTGNTLAIGTVSISPGAALTGFGGIAGAVVDDGTLLATGGALKLMGDTTGAGTLLVGSSANLVLGAGAGSSLAVDFLGTDGTLKLDDFGGFDAAITSFGTGNLIDVANFAATTTSTLTLGASDVLSSTIGGETLNLTFSSAATGDTFILTPDGAGGTDIMCYLRGTKILTPAGRTSVEDLKIGDRVVTWRHASQRIKWIGRQSSSGRFIQNNRDQIPIRIQAGALGENLPRRDLYVSPGHSMLLQNTLVLAKSLVNGVTIAQHDVPAEVFYHHIELASHDCV